MRKNRADPVHIMKSCDAFIRQGVDVELVTPRFFHQNWSVAKQDIWQLYGLKPSFPLVELPTFIWEETLWEKTTSIQRLLAFFIYFWFLAVKTKVNPPHEVMIIYCKCYGGAIASIWVRRLLRPSWKLIFEKADWDDNNKIQRYIVQHMDGVVAINEFIREQIISHYQISPRQVYVMPFYSDINSYQQGSLTQQEARVQLSLPLSDYLVGYTGKMGIDMPEINFIIEAATLNPDKIFVLVGARDHVKIFYETYCKNRGVNNVILRGFQPLERIYTYLLACDLLVSYYENDFLSAYCRVPAKLSLYVCAERPIILANLPSLRAILTDDLAYFVPPELPTQLAKTIQHIAQNPQETKVRAMRLHDFAIQNDLNNFAQNIVAFLERV
jgi:glycosyltransferase involved in cell wall biosynthesis